MIRYQMAYPIQTVAFDGMIRPAEESRIRRSIETLREAGVDAVMVSGYQLEEPAAVDLDRESRRIGELLRSSGLRTTQHHGLAALFASPGKSQNAVREKLFRSLDFTANLKAETLVVHSGRPEGRHNSMEELQRHFLEEAERHGLEAVRDMIAENLHAAGEYAQKIGVKLCLENCDRFEPLADPVELPALVEKADHPAVGYCFDSGHAHAAGSSIPHWIERMGKKLFTTHLHDNRGPLPGRRITDGFMENWVAADEHQTPGLGTIGWRDLVGLLHRHTDLDAVTFETGPWPHQPDPVSAYRNAVAFWRMVEDSANEDKSGKG